MRQHTSTENELIRPDGSEALTAFSDTAGKVVGYMMLAVIATVVTAMAHALYTGDNERMWLSSFLCLSIVGFCYREIRRGNIERGITIFCWGFWLCACLYSYLVAGIRTPILVVIPSIIMIVAWSQGRPAMLLMLLLTMLFLASYVVAENNQWLPAPITRSAASMLITYAGVIINASIIALVIAENFNRLVSNGKKLAADLQHRLTELNLSDEALRNLNNQLEQRVLERTMQYDETNKTLQNLVAKLELAQMELVQSEKLASLGSMVAGISHELNTPVGNALMLTSSLENLFQQISQTINSGQVKRSELDELLKSGTEMAALATKSTRRAVDLMSSFKQVAVDQTSEQRRNFNLYNVIEDNLATLLPTIKKQHKAIRIVNQVSNRIECDSFPGPLGQIIVNLTHNAILHGFDGRDSGVITIAAEQLHELVLLTVSDDGVGMEPATVVHVFDPFFTTKLGKGGSGIGLSVSYRIATSVLGGNLTVSSSPDYGAQFSLTMPMVAPYKF